MPKHLLPLQSGQVSGKMDGNRVFATRGGQTYSKRFSPPKQPVSVGAADRERGKYEGAWKGSDRGSRLLSFIPYGAGGRGLKAGGAVLLV